MTREQKTDILVAGLLIGKYDKEKEDGIERILRQGWKGFDNFSDEELEQEINNLDEKYINFLLSASELIEREQESNGK